MGLGCFLGFVCGIFLLLMDWALGTGFIFRALLETTFAKGTSGDFIWILGAFAWEIIKMDPKGLGSVT